MSPVVAYASTRIPAAWPSMASDAISRLLTRSPNHPPTPMPTSEEDGEMIVERRDIPAMRQELKDIIEEQG